MKIKKTGNFWIDNGLVALYKIINELDYGSLEISISEGDLCIELEDKKLEEVLNLAKDKVEGYYLKKTEGGGWFYNDNEFKIYQKTDFKPHLKSFFTGKTPKTEGGLVALSSPTLKKGKDRMMSETENNLFLQFKENNKEVKFGTKKVKIEDRGFINTPPVYNIGNEFQIENLNSGKKLCDLSGEYFDKTTTITGMNFPFMTGSSGELNFSSHLKKKLNVSSLYDFISTFSFYNLYYLLQGDMKHYFVLYDSNLEKLSEFLNIIQQSADQVNNNDYNNFDTALIGTVYEDESLFNFLLSIYNQVKQQFQIDQILGELLSKSVFVLSNDGNIFRQAKQYSSISALFSLFESFSNFEDEVQGYFNHFVNMIRYFTKRLDGGKYDTTFRNKLCGEILSFKSPYKTIEFFLSEVKLKGKDETGIMYLDKIIQIYNNKIRSDMNSKTEMVEMCKSLGQQIGKYCQEANSGSGDKGILFSIRNAKNRTEFLNVLSEIQFRIDKPYFNIENFLKEILDSKDWEEYKSLVSIFAMNRFLYVKKDKTSDN